MILDSILNKTDLSKNDIIYLLELSDITKIRKLYDYADKIRQDYCSDEIHLRGIIEFSNNCNNNCLYCGLRKDNNVLERYRMTPDEIINTAKSISNAGVRTIVLQSGFDTAFDTDMISYIIYSIKQISDLAITLSLGERNFEEYKTWKYAGADRYLLKHESANPKLYSLHHEDQKVQTRIEHLKFLKSIGYQIGSGNLIGLPDQTVEDIADDLLLCKELDVDMAAFSPFIPSPFTPFGNKRIGSVELTLKTIAIGRILLKSVHIPATTAIASIDDSGREKALKVGANVIMPNFTPKNYRDKYCIYPNKRIIIEDSVDENSEIQHLLNTLGRVIAITRGDSIKKPAEGIVNAHFNPSVN